MIRSPFLLSLLLLAAACSDRPPTDGGRPTAGQPPTPMGAHGEERSLGTLSIGGRTIEVVQAGKVTPGQEAFFDLHVRDDRPMPAVVRGWIGIETAEGSMKARFGKEGDRGLHAHIEVPKVLPAGSRLWIEVEDGGTVTRASTAWQ
jgi:hypothetical protein